MKILQISSIFPIPLFPDENPYVKNYIYHYKSRFKEHEFLVAKPITYYPDVFIRFKYNQEKWKKRKELSNRESELLDDINITYLPYMSIGSISLLHIIGSFLGYIRNRSRLNGLISDVDVTHAHYLFPDGLIAYFLKRKFNTPYTLTLRQETRFLKNKISQSICRRIIEDASICSTQSYHMHQALLNLHIQSVNLLPTGIENYFFETKNRGVKVSKTRLNIVSVCNLLPIKNIESVIKAIKVFDLKSKVKYHIYGTGPEKENLEKLSAKLGLDSCIKFMGHIDNTELPAVYSKYDLFVQPSFKETFGLTYFEALASGLPVVLSQNTGAYPLIEKYDVSFVVDPYSVDSIGRCLQNIITNPEQLSNKKNRTTEAAKIASWENYVKYFHRAYKEAIV